MAQAEAPVRAAFEALAGAFERHDLDAALTCCTENVIFIGSGEGEEAVGHAGVREMFAALADATGNTSFRIDWESVAIEVRGDVGLITAFGLATLGGRDGTTTARYRLTGVLLRIDDRWLWHVHHGSEPGAW